VIGLWTPIRSSSVSIPSAFRTERRTRRLPALYNFLTSIEGQSLFTDEGSDPTTESNRAPKKNLDNIKHPGRPIKKSASASDLDHRTSATFRSRCAAIDSVS